MPLIKPSTMLYYICKYSKFSCIKNKKRGENSLLFKYCVGKLGIFPFVTLYGRKTSVTNYCYPVKLYIPICEREIIFNTTYFGIKSQI